MCSSDLNAASGERMFSSLVGHGGYLRCVNWSPDSKKIVTAALDNLIRVFVQSPRASLFSLTVSSFPRRCAYWRGQ